MARLFIAIDLPDDQTASLQQLRDDSLSARWTPEEQYHLTMRFIGEIEDSTTEQLIEALREIEAEPFTLSGQGVDVFPSRRRPRVLVSRIEPEPRLMALQKEINRAVVMLGLPEDRKSFNPHVTFARLRDAQPRQVRGFLKQHEEHRIEPFLADRFHLYRSDLHPEGAVHTIRSTFWLDSRD